MKYKNDSYWNEQMGMQCLDGSFCQWVVGSVVGSTLMKFELIISWLLLATLDWSHYGAASPPGATQTLLMYLRQTTFTYFSPLPCSSGHFKTMIGKPWDYSSPTKESTRSTFPHFSLLPYSFGQIKTLKTQNSFLSLDPQWWWWWQWGDHFSIGDDHSSCLESLRGESKLM